MVFIVSALCIVNLILWVVFLSKFKKLFTADDVISSYRQELNRLLTDIDRHTARDVATIEDVSKELKAVVAEADRHVAVAKAELERQEKSKTFQQKLAAKPQGSARQTMAQRAADSYLRTAPQGDAAFAVTGEGRRQLAEQGTLFDDAPTQSSGFPSTTFTMEQSGASYASVPVLTPQVSFVDEPVQAKKAFGERVKELTLRGESIDNIARILECSTTEVQFVLDMGI